MITLEDIIDKEKKGEKNLPDAIEYRQAVSKAFDIEIKKLDDKILMHQIDLDEEVEKSNTDKFAVKRLEIQIGQRKSAIEEAQVCAAGDYATAAREAYSSNNPCKGAQLAIAAKRLTNIDYTDDNEYNRLVAELERLQEGPGAARIANLKEKIAKLKETKAEYEDVKKEHLDMSGTT